MEHSPIVGTAALEALRPGLDALARRIVAADAEDIVQEAMLRLTDDPVRSRSVEDISAWLRRVTLNLAINRRRDVNRWQERGRLGLAGVPSSPDEPDSLVIRREEREIVRSVLSRLSTKHQMVLHLRYTDHSYAEIAATLDMPVSSVGTTLARAERAFRSAYLEEQS